jgi:hypothetical protein
VVAVTGAVVAVPAAAVTPPPLAPTERQVLAQRVQAVRDSLAPRPQPDVLLAQSSSWTNWPKWSKWSNWANQ